MKKQGRYQIYVSCEQDQQDQDVRSITVTFGQGNQIRILSRSGRPTLQLASGQQRIQLDAGTGSGDLAWAVELLAAQLPKYRHELGLYDSESGTDGA